MKISVIVPVYNSEQYIGTCIEALQNQAFPRDQYEIIVVNNNSTDKSAEVIAGYTSVVSVHEKKQGAYAARNKGVSISKGSILAFTDSDCAPRHDWLKRIYDSLCDPKTGLILGQSLFNGKSTGLVLLGIYEKAKAEYVYNTDQNELYYGRTNNMAVRREIYEAQNGFTERLRGGDCILVRRAVDMHSSEIAKYCPQMRVDHLEIKRVFDFYKKFFIYGRSIRLFKSANQFRPLNSRERLFVYRQIVRDGNFGYFRIIHLFVLLLGGLFFWNLGSMYGLISRNE